MFRSVALGLTVCLLLLCWWAVQRSNRRLPSAPPPSTTAQQNQQASPSPDLPTEKVMLSDADYRQAQAAFQQLYPNVVPDELDLLSITGEMAIAQRRYDVAIYCFERIPAEHPKYGLSARLQQASAHLELNQAALAKENFIAFLDAARVAPQVRAEDVVYAFKWLNYILSVNLQIEQRKQYLHELHQLGIADILDAKQYLFPSLLLLNSANGRNKAEQFAKAVPQDWAAQIAVARYQAMNGQYESALNSLQSLEKSIQVEEREAVQDYIALAKLEIFFDSGMSKEFDDTVKGLPEFEPDEPWSLTRFRGEHALQQAQYQEAIRLFSSVLASDPANAPSQMGLAECYKAIQDAEAHAEALRRSAVLAKIRADLPAAQADKIEAIQALIADCESIAFQEAVQVLKKYVGNPK